MSTTTEDASTGSSASSSDNGTSSTALTLSTAEIDRSDINYWFPRSSWHPGTIRGASLSTSQALSSLAIGCTTLAGTLAWSSLPGATDVASLRAGMISGMVMGTYLTGRRWRDGELEYFKAGESEASTGLRKSRVDLRSQKARGGINARSVTVADTQELDMWRERQHNATNSKEEFTATFGSPDDPLTWRSCWNTLKEGYGIHCRGIDTAVTSMVKDFGRGLGGTTL